MSIFIPRSYGEWQALVAAARGRVEAGAETDAFYEEMRNLVNALGDEHSQFQSPAVVAASEAELAGTNDYVGIGVLIKPLLENELTTILSAPPRSAASRRTTAFWPSTAYRLWRATRLTRSECATRSVPLRS
jgi:hypothetical protein